MTPAEKARASSKRNGRGTNRQLANSTAVNGAAKVNGSRAESTPCHPGPLNGVDTASALRVSRAPRSGASEPISDHLGAAPALASEEGALHTEAPADDLTVLDSYAAASRMVPLLTKDEEVELGRELRETRAAFTQAIAGVPGAISIFLNALNASTLGHRPMTDVVFTPFGPVNESSAGTRGRGVSRDAPEWRPHAQNLSKQFDSWRRAASLRGIESAGATRLCARMKKILVEVDPSATVLGEMLHYVDSVTTKADAYCRRRDSRTGDWRKIATSKLRLDEQQKLKVLEAEAGVCIDELRVIRKQATVSQDRYLRARQHMVEANLRLAFHMARKLMGNGVALEDLVQEAILGLMRATEKFDYRMGYKFSTYASQWIWQGITRAVADGSRTIRVAAHMHDVIIRLNKVSRRMQQEYGREPTAGELASELGLPIGKVRKALDSARQPLSLDAPLPDFDDGTLSNVIEDTSGGDPSDTTHEDQMCTAVDDLLHVLPTREALIVRLRHGIGVSEPYTLEEIGRVLGITRERTRQLETRAMERLREQADPQLVDALMG